MIWRVTWLALLASLALPASSLADEPQPANNTAAPVESANDEPTNNEPADDKPAVGDPLTSAIVDHGHKPSTGPIGPRRKRRSSWDTIFSGPFHSSRLFGMPVADVVGAWVASLSGDGSLLQETGLLSSAGVLAIGFGDIAQLEYRHTGVIGVEKSTAPIPAVGVQLKVPIPERKYVPAFAVAFRLGLPRNETLDSIEVEETVTDLYVVARLHLWGWLERLTLHGGARISQATLEIPSSDLKERKTLVLPAGGWEARMNRRTRFIGEAALVPVFDLGSNPAMPEPAIDLGVLGRLGLRWYIHPSFTIDASIGYQLEVARRSARVDRDPNAVVEWDIRLGAEFFIPWGAVACRTAGIFCE